MKLGKSFEKLLKRETREKRRHLYEENKRYGYFLEPYDRALWPPKRDNSPAYHSPAYPINVMRSKFFLVQIFDEGNGITRMSVNRTELDDEGGWREGITWDELQELKTQAGFATRQAVEIYPSVGNVINVANIRHLWILPAGERMPFSW